MSLNYAFAFSVFLLILVSLNIYFFYNLNGVPKKSYPKTSNTVLKLEPDNHKDINEYLNVLPIKYKQKNPRHIFHKHHLSYSFSHSQKLNDNVWSNITQWTDNTSLFPNKHQLPGQILHAMRTSPIMYADNALKGTQLKLMLILKGNHKVYFKPKRYNIDEIISGNIYAGYDRHNSEVFGYYLAMILNLTWVAPSVIRKINIVKDLESVMAPSLKNTLSINENGLICIYGNCFYCKETDTVCPDEYGDIEGAAILYLDKKFKIYKSPWRRSYTNYKMQWEKDNKYCKKIIPQYSLLRLLDLIDISIFDFLIQNGDRHHYEVYKGKILLFDNGKGLGNPWVDELDILAPLYQCCLLRNSTWHQLETLSGGSITEILKLLTSIENVELTTEEQFKAVERRLLKIYSAVELCFKKHGKANVLKHGL